MSNLDQVFKRIPGIASGLVSDCKFSIRLEYSDYEEKFEIHLLKDQRETAAVMLGVGASSEAAAKDFVEKFEVWATSQVNRKQVALNEILSAENKAIEALRRYQNEACALKFEMSKANEK